MPIKTPQVVSPLPLPPNPADRSTFNTRAYPWSEALAPWTDQVNQLGADTLENAQSAQSDASSASSNAGLAAGYASSASTDAGLALGYKDAAYGSQQAAAGSASTASTASGQAQTARDLARQWASDTNVVADGLKGAKGYALDAAQSAADAASIVLGDVFDDTQESAVKGWTSSKIVAWFNGLTTAFTRTILGRSNAQQVRDDLQLTYPATASTVGDGVAVLREGAGGWLGQGGVSATPLDYPASIDDATNLTKTICSDEVDNGVGAFASGIHFSTINTWGRVRVDYLDSRAWVQGGLASHGTGWTVELYHSGNLFADASGVMTNGAGQLSSDMSDFLSSDTFDEMSSKVGGSGEIDSTIIATNATSLTPQPGKSYWLIRNTAAQLVTTLTCTHRPSKIRSWHMIVSKGAGAGDNFIPKFALTGLSQPFAAWSGGGVEPPVVSGVSHVMIAFTQIDQSVRAMVVDGW